MSKLSIVVPIYYNQDNLKPLYDDLKKVLTCIEEYEIVMVDDGSGDGSWNVMKELAKNDRNIKLIKLSRNFGSHAAILAGLIHSTGDCAVVKAADLQEPSELLISMYEKWKEGNKVVLAVREGREEGVLQKAFSKLYYWLVRKMALSNMPATGFDIFLVDRKVIKVLEMMDEKNSAITLQVLWSGFQTTCIGYTRKERKIGKSKWTFNKKIKLVVDSIISFSFVPIRFMSGIGAAFFFASIIWGVYVIVEKLLGKIIIPGYTTLIILLLFSAGLIMFTLGILGEYIWRTLDAGRSRPIYIIDEIAGNNAQEKK